MNCASCKEKMKELCSKKSHVPGHIILTWGCQRCRSFVDEMKREKPLEPRP